MRAQRFFLQSPQGLGTEVAVLLKFIRSVCPTEFRVRRSIGRTDLNDVARSSLAASIFDQEWQTPPLGSEVSCRAFRTFPLLGIRGNKTGGIPKLGMDVTGQKLFSNKNMSK